MRKYFVSFRWALSILGFFTVLTLNAQENTLVKSNLDTYIQEQQIEKAALLLDATIKTLKKSGRIDSLYPYPYYVAKIERLRNNTPGALNKMALFVEDMESENATQRSLYLAKMSMADFYDEVGENQKSFEITQETLIHVQKADGVTLEAIGKVRYNLGVCYFTLDDLPKAKTHLQAALEDYLNYPKTSKKFLSDSYNALGAIMWLSTKLDSAKYYYKKAAETIKLAKGDSIENLYNGTVIQSNVSLLEYSQGNFNMALEIQNKVIRNYEKVIQGTANPELKSRAQRFQARAISNLATFYNEAGNLSRANELVRYAYAKKALFLEPLDEGLASNLIQIGQSELSLKSFRKAITALNSGLKMYQDKGTTRPYWQAAAYNALASAYQELGKVDSATYYYKIAQPLFEKALGDNIDAEYLSFLENKAEFESNNKNLKAIETAHKGYDYVVNQVGEESFEAVKQMLSLATVYYNLEDYDKAQYWSDKGDLYLSKKSLLVDDTVDAIRINFNRPLFVLIKARSRYKQLENYTVNDLMSIKKELDVAIKILERRKEVVLTPEDTNQLLLEYKAINDFSKRLNLELYNMTSNSSYLLALMTAQESGVYNKIRAKLNSQQNVSFLGISQKILDQEKEKKEALSTSLSIDSTSTLSYYNKEKEWLDFLKNLKQEYPNYYKMRYSNIEIPVDEIVNEIPEDVSVIRYFFVEEELHVFVANKGEQHLIFLDGISYSELTNTITAISDKQFEEDDYLQEIFELYQKLWQPLVQKKLKKKIVVIPDGPLYNLSFEMLTPTRVSQYSQLFENSILSKHILSYKYSLLLFKNKRNSNLGDNFIAFTPEFSESMKSDYKIAIKDSLDIDHTYLTLLPQPFSVTTAANYNKIFKGEHFKNKQATKQLFMEQAGEHKIIHIGTHAESNNISPELSRLLFAKPLETGGLQDDNSLYTYEIYNCNLTSNLAILTACETGKPGYQAGEGMISLAHAFTYAGSESILTSLWKIDEKSSAEIVSYFYDNLGKGIPKDQALQEAKIQYLKTAQGRTLQPNYWAGLVLIGDTSPLELKNSWPWWTWILIVILMLIALVTLSRKRNH